MSNRKIVDYYVLEQDSRSLLGEAVLAYMSIGWEPLGGVSHCVYQEIPKSIASIGTHFYNQAVVKYEAE